jgi:hypothetical protein
VVTGGAGGAVVVVVGTICVLTGGSAAGDAYGPGSAGDTAVVVMTVWIGAATTAGLIVVSRRCGPPNASTSTALSRASSFARDGGVGLFEEPPHVGAGTGVAQVGQDLAGGLSAPILRDHTFARTPVMQPGCVTERVTRRTRPATGIAPLAALPWCLEAPTTPIGCQRLLLDDAVRRVHPRKRNEANAFRRIGRRRWPCRN